MCILQECVGTSRYRQGIGRQRNRSEEENSTIIVDHLHLLPLYGQAQQCPITIPFFGWGCCCMCFRTQSNFPSLSLSLSLSPSLFLLLLWQLIVIRQSTVNCADCHCFVIVRHIDNPKVWLSAKHPHLDCACWTWITGVVFASRQAIHSSLSHRITPQWQCSLRVSSW